MFYALNRRRLFQFPPKASTALGISHMELRRAWGGRCKKSIVRYIQTPAPEHKSAYNGNGRARRWNTSHSLSVFSSLPTWLRGVGHLLHLDDSTGWQRRAHKLTGSPTNPLEVKARVLRGLKGLTTQWEGWYCLEKGLRVSRHGAVSRATQHLPKIAVKTCNPFLS